MAYYLKALNDRAIKRKVKYRAGESAWVGGLQLPCMAHEQSRQIQWFLRKTAQNISVLLFKIYQMHIFKLFSVHICQLFAQLREIPVTCYSRLWNKQVGCIQLLPLLHYSCHEVCRICHLEVTGQVAPRTARIMEHTLVSATV